MKMRRGLLAGLATGALALAAGAWWRSRQLDRAQSVAPAGESGPAEQALWSVRLERPEGGELALADFRGRHLVVNFWATWCPPCIKELPDLDRFQAEFGGAGWQVVGIAVDSPSAVRDFLARRPLRFPTGLAGLEGSQLSRTLGNAGGGLPFTVVTNPEGRIVRRKLGATHYEELRDWARAR